MKYYHMKLSRLFLEQTIMSKMFEIVKCLLICNCRNYAKTAAIKKCLSSLAAKSLQRKKKLVPL